ncbi:MAG: glutathione S-transferase family protein [Rhodopila sp.]|nr:glutathione S-transferase family protein [Rhodopila sp.]
MGRTMKLYITPGSPYARIARIIILEKRLDSRVELVLAQTRSVGSPYYLINPSGRVPYLVLDNGVGMEESSVICRYLDHLDGHPEFDLPTDDQVWEVLRLGARASSLLDGLSVWLREIKRPEGERSTTTIQHEADRARRLLDCWETEISLPPMRGPLNLVQITLTCALGLEARLPDFCWRESHPKLCDWFAEMAARPSVLKTIPSDNH